MKDDELKFQKEEAKKDEKEWRKWNRDNYLKEDKEYKEALAKGKDIIIKEGKHKEFIKEFKKEK
jgi:hypothetical protein